MKNKKCKINSNVIFWLKRTMLFLLATIVCGNAFAYDFVVDGIYYNILYNNEAEVTYKSLDNCGYSGAIVIPSHVRYEGITYTVNTIGISAFRYSSTLSSVIIPDGVLKIDDYAFDNCTGISSIILPNSVLYIGTNAFQNCSNLKTITIPSSIEYVGATAFAMTPWWNNLSNGLIYIGNVVYQYKGEMPSNSSITIKNGIKSISPYAFSDCSGLSNVKIPNSVISIGYGAFYGCENLSSIDIPKEIEVVEGRTYSECKKLRSISIPQNVKTIGQSAFEGCSGLTDVVLCEGLNVIENEAFSNCTSLTELSIPQSVRSIGDRVLYYCTSLSAIKVKYVNPIQIGNWTFVGNYSNTTLYVPSGCKDVYKNDPFWGRFKEIIEDEVSYSLSISSFGSGEVSFSGTAIRNETSTFILDEGSSATILFAPDNGCRIKSVKVDNTDATSNITNNQYTINNINKDTNVEVEFEAITHTLSIKASGNGIATYDGTTIRNKTTAFTVIEGSSATVKFTPDNGYQIKSVKVNSTNVTSSVSNSQYTISNITADTTLEVEFEAIPPTTYTLSIKSTGNGSVSYNSTAIRNTTKIFTVNEGTLATISVTPDDGFKIKSVKKDGTDVTSSVSNGKYTISNIQSSISVEVEFEVITHTLSIKATGNGSASYNSTTIRNTTKTFTVNEGASATINISPDEGYRIKSVKKDGTDVTSSVSNNKYTVSDIQSDTSVEVEFEAITHTLSIKATGNGSASYNSTAIRNTTKTFTVNEGTSATISITPDDGYRIKSVKKGGTDVTTSVSNNIFTVSNIQSDTSVEVEFEAITHTLSIKATGYGVATYDGTNIRGKTMTFTVNEGSLAIVKFTPDNGYRIKSVKLNSTNITSNVYNSQYTISNITFDTSLEVEFEEIGSNVNEDNPEWWGYVGINDECINIGTQNAETYHCASCYSKDNPVLVGKDIKAVRFRLDTKNVKNVKVWIAEKTPSNYSSDVVRVMDVAEPVQGINEVAFPDPYTIGDKDVYVGYTFTITKLQTEVDSYPVCCAGSDMANGLLLRTSSTSTSWSDFNGNGFGCLYMQMLLKDSTPKTYTMSVKATGNGSASYNSTTIRNTTKTFTVDTGTTATISFTPDNGYKIKSLKKDGIDVTSSVSNNKYTVSNIQSNTAIEVEFEAIMHTLSITASGNGVATFEDTNIRGKTTTFTVNDGSSATVKFTPDDGYQIKKVKLNSYNITSYVYNSQYTISTITAETTLEVEFEAIPPTTYTLSIKATGYGSALYNSTAVRNTTKTFTVNEGASATISFTSDDGYRIKSVKKDGINVTSSVSNNNYIVSNIQNNTSVEVEFETVPPTTYTLSIKATGNGAALYNSTYIRNTTKTFNVNKGASATISFESNIGYHIKSLVFNGIDRTSYVSNNQYTVNNIIANAYLEVEFEANPTLFACEGVNYSVISFDDKTVRLAKGNYGKVLDVPATIRYMDTEWTVIGVDDDAFDNAEELAAIIWHPETSFNATMNNPNLLLYVNKSAYTPASIKNVVVNGIASSITLTDAESGNNFYCPQEFMAQHISYNHNYKMTTGIGIAKGWETIALPFDVQTVMHEEKGEIVPFAKWQSGDSTKPFWLMRLEENGWKAADGIKANTPYIISMPNNGEYKDEFLLNGRVTFSAENVTIRKTENMQTASYKGRTFVPSYSEQAMGSGFYVLNVSNDYETNISGVDDGSRFVLNLRKVHPFEAYMITSTNGTRSIDISDGMDDGIEEEEKMPMRVYNLKGLMMKTETGETMEDFKRTLPSGVYIINGHKMIVK